MSEKELIEQHMRAGSVEKCICVMSRIVDEVIDDAELIYQAKLGLLKRELSVTDKESTQAVGRKKFMINILNRVSSSADREDLRIHLLADFRCFCFHVDNLRLAKKWDLIAESFE